MGISVLVASTNPHKIAEFRGLLDPHRFEVLSPSDLGIRLNIDETGLTFKDNARSKAEAFAREARMLCVSDDSGLVVAALAGEPGIHSARFAGPGASDGDRVDLLLQHMEKVPAGQRAARFVCVVAVARPNGPTRTFEGTVEGVIAPAPRGTHGFGYDPIFIYPPTGQTFAEMSESEKSEVSHRGQAVRAAASFLRTL